MSILGMRLSTTIVSALKYNTAIIPLLSRVTYVKHYRVVSSFRPLAEPLQRYQPGGYHPILIGDLFKNQRYRVIQKLGWDGNSTTWVARDQLLVLPLHPDAFNFLHPNIRLGTAEMLR
jgi:hypothetical protein